MINKLGSHIKHKEEYWIVYPNMPKHPFLKPFFSINQSDPKDQTIPVSKE